MNKTNKRAFTLAEGATHVDTFNNKRKFGFTLAEVLITLGIIGVVAALTIPVLIQNYQLKVWSVSADVFEKKLTESIKTMNVQGKLGKYGKYNDTEGFVEELQKHFKITKVCDNNSLMQCFDKTITMNDEVIDLSSIKTAKDFGQDDWNTNVMGIQFANGVTGLIAYNPECKGDPHNNRITGGDCYALVYDTSGFSEPNEIGKDARMNANVLKLGGDVCAFEIGGTCYRPPVTVSPHVWNACNNDGTSVDSEDLAFMQKYGMLYCMPPVYGTDDYLAGAAKACGGKDKISSVDINREMALLVYNGITTCPAYTECRDDSKLLSLGFKSLDDVSILTSEEEKWGSDRYMQNANGQYVQTASLKLTYSYFGSSGLSINTTDRNRVIKQVMCAQ